MSNDSNCFTVSVEIDNFYGAHIKRGRRGLFGEFASTYKELHQRVLFAQFVKMHHPKYDSYQKCASVAISLHIPPTLIKSTCTLMTAANASRLLHFSHLLSELDGNKSDKI